MAPYQAFAIGGPGSVRGYGEGAVGSGRSCLVANSELTFPLVCNAVIISLRTTDHYMTHSILVHTASIYSSLILHRNLKEKTYLALNTYVAAVP